MSQVKRLLSRSVRRFTGMPSGPSAAPPDAAGSSVAQLVAAADAALVRSGPAAAVQPLTDATALAFHRALHFDGLSSPLAQDPAGYLAPLRQSTAWARATGQRGRRSPAAPPPAGRKPRLLFVTFKNWKFADPIVRAFAERDDVEVRRLDLLDLPKAPLSPLQQVRLRLTGPDDARSQPWAGRLAEELDWADTVFCDWLQRGTVLLTALDPGATRIVVRLHSFEAFTVFPHLVDYSRIDDLVVVGDHVGRFLQAVVPYATTPQHLVPNAADLHRFVQAKDDDARFTLAVVGYGVVAKDPLWAVELLAHLRAHDPRYRLLLVGADFDPATSEAVAAYRQQLQDRLARPDVAGAVRQVEFTTDVPGLLREVGVIVSSSVRESFHLALVEGAASGAIPVVRDWPLFAAAGGPAGLFPAEWIVNTVEDAAQRVLAATGDAQAWRAEGQRSARWVLDRYDWSITKGHYEELLLPPR